MVRAGQHLIVEGHHRQRQQQGAAGDGPHQGANSDATGLEGRDLVLGRHATERVKRRHQHGHGKRHGDRERQRQHEELRDGFPGKPLAGQIGQLARDVLQHEQRRQGAERKQQGSDVLTHDIAGNEFHDVTSLFTTGIIKGAGADGRMNVHELCLMGRTPPSRRRVSA